MTKLRGYRDRADAAAVYLRLFYRQRQPEDARGCFVSVHRQRLLYLPLVGGDPRCAQDAEGALAAAENMRNAEIGNPTNNGGVETQRFSIRDDAKTEIKKLLAGENLYSNVILTDTTPAIMIGREGVRNLPLAMKPSHIRENILSETEAKAIGLKTDGNTHFHGLGEDLFYKVIDGLNDVTEAYRGTKNASDPERGENYFLLVSKFKDQNDDVINVPVFINTKGQYNQMFMDTNTVATVFGRSNLRDYINAQLHYGNLVRIKKKGNTASELTGLIPGGYSGNASTDSISNPDNKVNPKGKKSDRAAADLFDDDLLYSDDDTDLLTHHLQHHNEAIGEVLRRTADVKLSGTTLSVDPTGDGTVGITDVTVIRRHLAHLSSNPDIGQPIV